jgi:hypothetical protein
VGGRGTRYPVVLRHFISGPKSVIVEEGVAGTIGPSAVSVTDAEGTETLVRLFEPPALEAS